MTNRATEISALITQLAALMAEPSAPVSEPREPSRPRVLLTVDEAAELLGIGKTKTYEFVMSGQLKSVLIGRLRRIHVDAVNEFAARIVANSSAG